MHEMDPFLLDSLFQAYHVTYCVLSISHRSNKTFYEHSFLWNHPVLIHTWELLHSVFIHNRNKHTIYSLKRVSQHKNPKISWPFSRNIIYMINVLQNISGVTFNSCWLYLGNILFCFSKHSFCLQPTIQRSRCSPHSRGNVWEGQSHDQLSDGIFGNWPEFFIFLATSWQTPSFFIHYWNRAANIRQSYKLRQ